jgi:hypothetical protein
MTSRELDEVCEQLGIGASVVGRRSQGPTV